jgi:hypothetical protein
VVEVVSEEGEVVVVLVVLEVVEGMVVLHIPLEVEGVYPDQLHLQVLTYTAIVVGTGGGADTILTNISCSTCPLSWMLDDIDIYKRVYIPIYGTSEGHHFWV